MLKIPHSEDTTVIVDPTVAYVFAASITCPFAFVCEDPLEMEGARNNFEEMGLELGAQVFVTCKQHLNEKASVLPPNLKFRVGQKTSFKETVQSIIDYGYEKVQSINTDDEFRTVGDIIDIGNARIMFFGDEVEQIKFDNNPVEIVEIAPIPEKCKVESKQTVLETLQDKVGVFITLDGNKMLVWVKSGEAFKPFESKKEITINTAPVANFFSALSVLVPEVLWNIKTRGKTVVVYCGHSRAFERYLEQKGVSFRVTSPDNITPNAINIIYQGLGVSFELLDFGTVIYSVGGVAPPTPTYGGEGGLPPLRGVGVTPTDFILPSEGGYVVHEKHGLGRYVGKKKMKLAAEVKEYLVLQYDGGTFVYLPVEQIDKLNNYHGAPRRLDRI